MVASVEVVVADVEVVSADVVVLDVDCDVDCDVVPEVDDGSCCAGSGKEKVQGEKSRVGDQRQEYGV